MSKPLVVVVERFGMRLPHPVLLAAGEPLYGVIVGLQVERPERVGLGPRVLMVVMAKGIQVLAPVVEVVPGVPGRATTLQEMLHHVEAMVCLPLSRVRLGSTELAVVVAAEQTAVVAEPRWLDLGPAVELVELVELVRKDPAAVVVAGRGTAPPPGV